MPLQGLDKAGGKGILGEMFIRLVFTIVLTVSVLTAVPVHAIDGDFGSPYDPAQQNNLVPRAPGEQPVYGGRGAAVPPLSWTGMLLALAGGAALGWWQLRAERNR